MNYQQIKNMYENSRKRKLKGNTYIVKLSDNGIGKPVYGIKFHNTVIITYFHNGFMINTGGYHTKTTKSRLNEYLPIGRVYQENFEWFFEYGMDRLEVDDIEGLSFSYKVFQV